MASVSEIIVLCFPEFNKKGKQVTYRIEWQVQISILEAELLGTIQVKFLSSEDILSRSLKKWFFLGSTCWELTECMLAIQIQQKELFLKNDLDGIVFKNCKPDIWKGWKFGQCYKVIIYNSVGVPGCNRSLDIVWIFSSIAPNFLHTQRILLLK